MMIATETILNIRSLADSYCRSSGIGGVADREPIKCNAEYHRAVADAFSALPRVEIGRTIEAYTALSREVSMQFDHLQRAGIRFTPFGDDVADPYGNRSESMVADLMHNGHLWVYDGGKDHPVLSRAENWRFRAVHDVFGHAMHRYSFGPNGEESAYRCHLAMFSPLAGLALATETRGQNSWFNHGPFSHLPRADRPFAEQKAAILPGNFRVAY